MGNAAHDAGNKAQEMGSAAGQKAHEAADSTTGHAKTSACARRGGHLTARRLTLLSLFPSPVGEKIGEKFTEVKDKASDMLHGHK